MLRCAQHDDAFTVILNKVKDLLLKFFSTSSNGHSA